MKDFNVILLAGGKSRRLTPLKDKNMLSFIGKDLICWQLDSISKLNPSKVIIVVNESNKANIESVCHGSNMVFAVQPDNDPGMAGGIRAASQYLSSESVLLVSGNDVVENSAFKVLESDADIAILGMRVETYFDGGYILHENNNVKGIVEKPGKGKEPSDFINIVVHFYKHFNELIEALNEVKTDSDDAYERALTHLITRGKRCEMVPYKGFWQPLKWPWHVLKLDEYFLGLRIDELSASPDYHLENEALIHKTAVVSPKATIKGRCLIEKDVKIFENAVIQGPVYLGEGSVVGNQALCRNSFTGKKCVVGYSTEVARSHLGNDVWTHSNYVGDSIIGNNVSFGAGAMTANLRLDEGDIKWQGVATGQTKLGLVCGDDVRVGVQTCIMPGLSIGHNSMIGGGITLTECVGENEFIFGKTELIRKPNNIDVKSLKRS